jgi:hypothetical protein
MNQIVLTIIGGVGVMAAALAAFFWFWAPVIEVPDNIDAFIAALQHISRVNAWGATAAGVAAVCAAITWLASFLGSS